MARPSRGPFAKRQKELARQERQKDKAARRLEAKDRKTGVLGEGEVEAEGEDPDLAGIRVGPQPSPEEQTSESTETE